MRRSRGDQHDRPLSGRVLAGCVAASVLTGLLVAARPLGAGSFLEVRDSLEVVAGVLFFGAGLLQLSVWRVDRDTARGHTGLALVVLGFLTPRITALGPALHDDVPGAVLSPWTATAAAVLALALGATGPGRLDRFVGHSRMVAASCAALLLGLLYLPLVLQRGLPFTLDVPRPVHLLVELAVAATWFAVAARLARAAAGSRNRGSGEASGRDSGRGEVGGTPGDLAALASGVMTTMGVVWLLRAAAVVAVQPWALAASVLMTLTAAVALAATASAFAEVSEAHDRRVAEAEEALAAAASTLTELDTARRSFRHDARNTMFALQAAAQVLAEHGGDLDTATRLRLRDAVRGQLTELEQLLTAQAGPRIPAQRRFGVIGDTRESA